MTYHPKITLKTSLDFEDMDNLIAMQGESCNPLSLSILDAVSDISDATESFYAEVWISLTELCRLAAIGLTHENQRRSVGMTSTALQKDTNIKSGWYSENSEIMAEDTRGTCADGAVIASVCSQAHADLIVNCVNKHDDLVGLLEMALSAVDELSGQSGIDGWTALGDRIRAFLGRAR